MEQEEEWKLNLQQPQPWREDKTVEKEEWSGRLDEIIPGLNLVNGVIFVLQPSFLNQSSPLHKY